MLSVIRLLKSPANFTVGHETPVVVTGESGPKTQLALVNLETRETSVGNSEGKLLTYIPEGFSKCLPCPPVRNKLGRVKFMFMAALSPCLEVCVYRMRLAGRLLMTAIN